MKIFIAVLAILLLAFGASFIYLRGDLRLGKETSNKVTSNKESGAGNAGTVAGDEVKPEPRLIAVEVLQKEISTLKVGEVKTLTAAAKDETGASVSVAATWSLSNPNSATLSTVVGAESKLTGRKVGKVKVLVAYKDLKAEKEVEVVSAGTVAGSTAAPTVTTPPSTGNVGVGTTAPPKPVVPFEIKLYDPSGARFAIGDSRTYTSQVQYTDNSLKTPDLDWSLSPSDLGSLDRSKGSSATFKALKSGSGTLKAVLGNLSSSLYIQVN